MTRVISLAALVLFLASSIALADPITAPIKLFGGKDLTNFYTYLKDRGKNKDPNGVFTVKDGVLRVSGEEWGALTTEKDFDNYHLIAEFKWGVLTFGKREKAARDSGICLHSVGPDGVAADSWMESIECQMIEGGTGDFILIKGNVAKVSPKLTCTAKQLGKGWYYDPKAPPRQFDNSTRINWFGRDPAWKDVKGFRGKNDVERPLGEWNTLECICAGDTITVILNGTVVNVGTNASHTRGKIQFQTEGAEVFFRRIDLLPLKK